MKDAADTYQGRGLIADPIHQYILYTRPGGIPGEATEQDLIDTPWVQRLRRVPQLQSARWVFPGRRAQPLPALPRRHAPGRAASPSSSTRRCARCSPTRPSAPLIEELLRMAGLLHDVGHGPFGHFFDDNFLVDYDLTHELRRPAHHPRGARRPAARSAPEPERRVRRRTSVIDPEWICYLMGKSYTQPLESHPKWLPVPEAAALGRVHRRQHGLRAARRLHVRGGGRADRHRPHHLLLVLLGEGPHARSQPAAGLHDVPERSLLHVHERLLPPHHARDRPAPQGDLPRHDADRVPV